MSTENINIEQIRRAWIEMGKGLGMQPSHEDNPNNFNKNKTALDRLRDKYRVFWSMAIGLMFGSFMIFSKGMIIENNLNLWLGIAYAVYFLTCFAMDFWLYRGIGTIDPINMTVADIVKKSIYYKKWHLRFMTVLIPMAIALIGFTGYVFSSEKYFLSGMIVGAICGVIIGIIQFRRFMADYRKLAE